MSNNTQQLYRFVKASERLPVLPDGRNSMTLPIKISEAKFSEITIYYDSDISALISPDWQWLEELPLPSNDAEQQPKIERLENELEAEKESVTIWRNKAAHYEKLLLLPAETNTLESAVTILNRKMIEHEFMFNDTDEEFIASVMEEYANQFKAQQQVEPVRFAEWLQENAWEIDNREQKTHTVQELYDIYLSSLNNK